ncbi:MAG: transporter substrate-binding domain-containing protein [Alphaproteobacteria bacterium]|nr:transporter substrate-binding domain-containing protein [Alphaproteobacteria bacterium]
MNDCSRRKFLALIAAGAATVGTPHLAGAQSTELRLGFFPFPPFNSMVAGRPTGSVIDQFSALAQEAGYTWRAEEVPVLRLRADMARGALNVAIITNRYPDLQTTTIWSKEPVDEVILEAYSVGRSPDISKNEDLAGKSVILNLGYSYAGVRPFIEDTANRVAIAGEAPTPEAALRMLQAGRAPILLHYRGSIREAQRTVQVPNLQSSVLQRIPIFIVVSKATPNAEKVLADLEAALAKLKANGRITPAS